MQDSQYIAAKQACSLLQAAGFESYIIGGAIRDTMLGLGPKDFDIATNATPDELLALEGLINPKHTDPAQAFGVTRAKVTVDNVDIPIEITTYREDIEAHLGRKLTTVQFSDIYDDIMRRDFTINALAYDPHNDFLLDLTDGLQDITGKKIRFIGVAKDRINEDPLRVLRAIRFKNRLGFSYEDSTFDAITEAISNGVLGQIAIDRVRTELTTMLADNSREEALQDLLQLGVIDHFLPELAQEKSTPQPRQYHAEGDVLTHTLLAMRYLPEVTSDRLAWATLLHDIGKVPAYQSADETGDRIRFSQHHSQGSELAKKILKRLKFSNKLTDEISWMVHYHMSTAMLPEMREGHAEHFMSHPAFADLIELLRADAHAAWQVQKDGTIDTSPPDLSQIETMYADFKTTKPKQPTLADLNIDGNWLSQEFKVSGAEIGLAKEKLEKALIRGELTNKKDVKSIISND